jgi:hypothetical protein
LNTPWPMMGNILGGSVIVLVQVMSARSCGSRIADRHAPQS